MALMCHGRVEFAEVERVQGVRMREAFAQELARLAPLAADGLVVGGDDAIHVTRSAWYLLRAVAPVFDRYIEDSASRQRFSRIV